MGKMGHEQIKRLIMSGKWERIGHTVMKTTNKITMETPGQKERAACH